MVLAEWESFGCSIRLEPPKPKADHFIKPLTVLTHVEALNAPAWTPRHVYASSAVARGNDAAATRTIVSS